MEDKIDADRRRFLGAAVMIKQTDGQRLRLTTPIRRWCRSYQSVDDAFVQLFAHRWDNPNEV